MRKLVYLAVFCMSFAFTAVGSLHAQESLSCSLGQIRERIAPHYPSLFQGPSPPAGDVQIQANFAADGHVTSTKMISGPPALKFDSEAFVHGWRAQASDGPRFCVISLYYRFDGSQRRCNGHDDVTIREERVDETHVTLHLSCDW
ncbi:MAG TPA: hypothetical protein VGN16_10140 [Acidobacteriaceae bacterium]